VDASGVTQDDLYRAWQRAVEAVGTGTSDDPDALTTAEICEFVLGYGTTEYQIRKARRQIRAWLDAGIVEPSRRTATTIDQATRPIPAFRLVEVEDEAD